MSLLRRRRRLTRTAALTATVAVSTLALTMASPLQAQASNDLAGPSRIVPLNKTVVLPFSLAISKGHVYVAEGADSSILKLEDGVKVTEARGLQGPGADVAGLAFGRNGTRLAYTTSNASHSRTYLVIRGPLGDQSRIDLARYEKQKNPDGKVRYGIKNPSQCVKDAFARLGAPASNTGEVDSHPYAVTALPNRSWAVVDSGGNDLLRVGPTGKVHTIAVLPAQPLKFTKANAKSLGLPGCVVGKTYRFESVPTDVEMGPDGWLYVSTLAGGPEDPSLGARSKVYRVNPHNGRVKVVAKGLAGATNLAIGPHGALYVTEYYSGKVTRIGQHNAHLTVANLPQAVSVESSAHGLYVGTTAAFGPSGPVGNGSVVFIKNP